MKNIIVGALLLISLNSFADGCSGAATFSATYNSAQCCWTFINTTNNDCSQWNCIWDFGDGSPPVTTLQGQGTTCHYYANPGSYTVSLIFDSSPCHGGNGSTCFGNSNINVTSTAPQLTVNSPIICLGQTTTLTASPSIGGGSYLWSNSQTSPSIVVSPTTTTNYTVVYNISSCSSISETVTVTVLPLPVVSIQATTVCSDVACGLTLGGPPGGTYNIITINSNGLSSSAGTPIVANGVLNTNLFNDAWTNSTNAPVNVIYTIVPVSAAACNGPPFTVTLTINPEPFISDQVLTVCSDVASSLSLGDDLNGPAVSFYEIASINFNGLSSSAGNPIIGINFSANEIIDDAYNNLSNTSIDVEYNVIPTGVNSCIGDPYDVIITVNPEPNVSDQGMTVCSEELIGTTLPNDANGPNIQSWNITNILIGDSLIPNSGNVTLGSTIYNQHIAGDIYLNTSTSGSFDVIYSVVPTSINNCIGELFTITITVHPNPIANFTDICGSLPATLTNTSIGAVNYYWDMGDGSPIITTKDIRYSYTIMDSMFYNIILIAETEFGCLDTASKIFTPPLLFYVPNTFTPDGDEFNNTFIPVFSNKNKVESIHLLIYNRWGEIVFESENIDLGWDGTYKNRKAQDGTYTWELIFTDNSCIGKKEHLYGHVNLIR